MDVFSNLNEPTNFGNFASVKKEQDRFNDAKSVEASKNSVKTALAKRQIAEVYQSLSIKEFIINERNNPYTIFNYKK